MKTDKSKKLEEVMFLGMKAFEGHLGVVEEMDEKGIGCTGVLFKLEVNDLSASCKIAATFEDGTEVKKEVSLG